MKSFRSWNRIVLLAGLLSCVLMFLPGPWGATLIGAAFNYVSEGMDPSRRAERELRRPRTYKPAAEELARYCQTPTLRGMSASKCGELGATWLPEGVLENVVAPLRASPSHSRAMISWGTVEVNLDSARISLQGDIGYHLERDAIDAEAETASWTLYFYRGQSRSPLYSFSSSGDMALTREEALARGRLGETRLSEHAPPGPSAHPGGTDLALYLGSSDEARAACRMMLELYPTPPPGIVLLNALLLVEEGTFADGENLMLDWLSSVQREDRHFFLACFYYYSERPEKVAGSLKDTLAHSGVPLVCSSGALALARYLYEGGYFDSVLEVCRLQSRPGPGYDINKECHDPYHELFAAAMASRNGPEVHGLPAWPATW